VEEFVFGCKDTDETGETARYVDVHKVEVTNIYIDINSIRIAKLDQHALK
jgi:hypothetical protein